MGEGGVKRNIDMKHGISRETSLRNNNMLKNVETSFQNISG